MTKEINIPPHSADAKHLDAFTTEIKDKSDLLVNYFLASYFAGGLVLAFFHNTWFMAIGVGGLSLLAYYATKYFFPRSELYQYVLSAVFGIFMIQYILQTNGMFEMQFIAFISSVMLITYQNWKLQLPLALAFMLHHALFGLLQFSGTANTNLAQVKHTDLQTLLLQLLLESSIFFLCGFVAYNLRKSITKNTALNFEMGRQQEAVQQRQAVLEMRDQLIATSDRLNEIEKIAHVGNWERNFTNNMLIWSDEMYRIFDIDKTTFNISYDAYLSFIHPCDRNNVNDICKKYLKDHQPFAYESRITTLKGIAKKIYVEGKVELNSKGEIIKTYGIIQDVTKHKSLEENIKQVEASLQTVLKN